MHTEPGPETDGPGSQVHVVVLDAGDLVVPVDGAGNPVGVPKRMVELNGWISAEWSWAELAGFESGTVIGFSALLGSSDVEPGAIAFTAYVAQLMRGDTFTVHRQVR